MKIAVRYAAVAIAVLFTVSCAESVPDKDYNEIEDEALAVWISSNAPDAQLLGDTGIYYEVLESEGGTGKVDVRGRWIDVDYVIRDLSGDIIYTRNEQTTRLLGSYTEYTHYVPDRLYIASEEGKSDIPAGLYRAFTNIMPGEMWRFYIPSRLAFASYGIDTGSGYEGQHALDADAPIIFDSVRIHNIVENPQQEGRDAIVDLVTAPKPEGWGKRLDDSVRYGMYLEIFNRIDDNDTVKMNESASIYYKVRFLDGKLINSNVDSVLYNNFGNVRSTDVTSAISVTRMETTPTNANQMPAKVFYEILPELCYGDIGRVAVPSEYAYYRQYMHPDMNENLWSSTATFTFDLTYQYDDYTVDDSDYYFGLNTFYMPSSSSGCIPIAEIKPYTPLIYEFKVERHD